MRDGASMAEEKEKKKLWLILLPPLLTTTAALTAAGTTIFVNMRNDQRAQAQAAAAAFIQRQQQELEDAQRGAAVPSAQRIRLQLDRIVVERDGAMGTADWRFVVEADAQPLFAFTRESISDRAGRNIVTPEPAPSAVLLLSPGTTTTLSVKGWRSAWYRRGEKPQVVGTATLTNEAISKVVEVDVHAEKSGRFLFQFSVIAKQE
ncbi:MAG: hypothetical protein LBV45_02935 [Xanthomonadaceae bacterium]|jgi:hypothetical protein|nr:hypothetical protein [Xanthomonadaceae bacterium]